MIDNNKVATGNFLLHGSDIIEVLGINPHCGDYCITTKTGWVYLKKCSPILITIDFLKEHNFLKDKARESYYIDIENGYNKFDLMWMAGNVYLKSRYQPEYLETQMLPHINYVHELQNLYLSLSDKKLCKTIE